MRLALALALAVASLPVAAPLAVASPPVAAPLAVASLPVAARLVVVSPLAAAPPATAAVGWARPVPGWVVSSFSYDPSAPFRAGARRGLRLAARRGQPVRAACSGAIEFSGRLPGGASAVTLRCGAWHVTHLDLEAVTAAAGRVRAGQPVGRAAGPSVRLGVRRHDDPWGYVDPAGLLPSARASDAPVGPRVRRTGPRVRRTGPRVRRTGPRVRRTGPRAQRSAPARWNSRPVGTLTVPRTAPVVPWTVWAGSAMLALLVLPAALRRGAQTLGARAGRSAKPRPSAARAGSP